MAIISKLRRSGWVLGIILVSLVLFVISDFITNFNKYTSGGGRGEVGTIAGNKIKIEDFDLKYKETLAQYEASGQPLDDNSRQQINTMVWNQLIQELIIEKEYDKLGLTVPQDEASILLYSNDAHQLIKQNFSQDNNFDPTLVKKIIDQNKKNPEAMYQIERIVKQVILETRTRKYSSLIKKSMYATSIDVEDDYFNNSTSVKGKIVTLNYISIPDKDVKVTDAEMEEYINKHKEDFKQTDLRDIDYAVWYIVPSKDDTLAAKEELAKDIQRFATTDNDSLFAVMNNTPYDNSFKNPGAFPKEVVNDVLKAPKDSVIGPLYYAGGYSLFKVKQVKEDSLNYVHLVKCEIPVKGMTKQDTVNAMAEANRIAAEARSSSNVLAMLNSKITSGEVQNPYDMGWFQEGNQSTDINNAVKSMGDGDVKVVKSMLGISVIKMVDPKSRKLIQCAEVRKNIEALKETEEQSFTKALNFRNSVPNENVDFEKLATKAGIAKSVAKDIKESDRMISGIPEATEIVRWLYNEDRKEGDFSDVFSGSTYHAVVRVGKIKKEGTKTLDDARSEVEVLVRNEKKAVLLKEKFDKVLPGAKTIEDVAIGVKSIAQPIEGLNFVSHTVPFAGNDPKIVGFIMGGKVNKLSKTMVSKDGVHVVFLESITRQPLPTSLEARKGNIYGPMKDRVYELVLASLTKSEDVKDLRYKFY